jgi:hypothetical protein
LFGDAPFLPGDASFLFINISPFFGEKYGNKARSADKNNSIIHPLNRMSPQT